MNAKILQNGTTKAKSADVTEIQTHVHRRVGRKVNDFQLVVENKGLILKGHSHSYYAKQLAQQAVMEATEMPILSNDIEVSAADNRDFGGTRNMLAKATITGFRQRLKALLRRLEGDRLQLTDEALEPAGGEANGSISDVPIDPNDLGSHVAEEELTLHLVGNEEQLMGEISGALARIEHGDFGRCVACEREISKQRLRALPYARHCFACAQNSQRQGVP